MKILNKIIPYVTYISASSLVYGAYKVIEGFADKDINSINYGMFFMLSGTVLGVAKGLDSLENKINSNLSSRGISQNNDNNCERNKESQQY